MAQENDVTSTTCDGNMTVVGSIPTRGNSNSNTNSFFRIFCCKFSIFAKFHNYKPSENTLKVLIARLIKLTSHSFTRPRQAFTRLVRENLVLKHSIS